MITTKTHIHPGPVIAERDGLRVVECHECGYAHLAEFPARADLETFYASEFWQKEKSGELALYEDRRAWWAMTHADWLSRLEAATLGHTLLDAGCGYGFFMQTARGRGWETHGIEPSQVAIDYCKAHELTGVWRGAWDSSSLLGKFDAISALWLIEHLPNPLEFLKWCRRHLYSCGALLIVCPNEWTRAQAEANEKVKKKFWFVDRTHLNYFNMATLGNLLGRAGFQVVEWLTSDPIERFISERLGNYVDDGVRGPVIHRFIEENELAMIPEHRLKRAVQRARCGEGRDIVAVCRVDA